MARFRYMVENPVASAEFYMNNFGFEMVFQVPPIAIINKGDLTLLLSGPKSSARRAMPDGTQTEPGGWNRIMIEVDDIEAEVERLRPTGITFRNEIHSGPGGSQIIANDPDGNAIEIFQPDEM
jgi:catechol 2,3-dioxygenase-like lactoylglutathione lyase family enzyme